MDNNKQQTISFLDLPPEIRNIVYQLAFRRSSFLKSGILVDEVDLVAQRPCASTQSKSLNSFVLPAFAVTCRTIAEESLPIFFKMKGPWYLNLVPCWTARPFSKHMFEPASLRCFKILGDYAQLTQLDFAVHMTPGDITKLRYFDFALSINPESGRALVKIPLPVELLVNPASIPYRKLERAIEKKVDDLLKHKEIKSLGVKEIQAVLNTIKPHLFRGSRIRL